MNTTKKYQKLVKKILKKGVKTIDPNRVKQGIYRLQLPHENLKFDLTESFPAVTIKPVYWKGIVAETIWLLSGDANLDRLHKYDVKIWDKDINRLDTFPKIYGQHWRDFHGDDQVLRVIESLKKSPTASDHLIMGEDPSGWRESTIKSCMYSMQFMGEPMLTNTRSHYLDLVVNYRSSDFFLGGAHNIPQYALILEIFAQLTGHVARTLYINLTNVHLYSNHLEQAIELLKRPAYKDPELVMPSFMNLDEVLESEPDDFELIGLETGRSLPAEMIAYDN